MIFSLIVIGLSSLLYLVIGVLVLLKSPQKLIHQSFFVFTLGAFLWSGAYIAMVLSKNFIFNHFILSGAVLGSVSLFILSRHLPRSHKKELSFSEYLSFIPPILLLIAIFSEKVITSVSFDGLSVTPSNGPYFLLFVFTLCCYFILSIRNLILSFHQSNPYEKNSLGFFFFGLISALVVIAVFGLLIPLLSNSESHLVSFFAMILLVVSAAYPLLCKRLMDVRVVIQTTFIYSSIIIFSTLLYGTLLFILQEHLGVFSSASLSGLLSVIIVSLTYRSIHQFLGKLTDRWLFRKDYSYKQELLVINKKISQAIELDEIISLVIKEVERVFHSRKVAFVIAHPFSSSLSLEPEMDSQGKTVLIPLHSRELFLGTLALYEKKSGDQYTYRDSHFLETLSYSLASRLRQALLVKELTNQSEYLKDELLIEQKNVKEVVQNQNNLIVDIAHNLQTPLTILKGEIQMLHDLKEKAVSHDWEHLDASVNRLSQFITRLLQAGDRRRERYHFEMQNVSVLLEDISEYMRTVLEEKGVELISDIEPEIVLYVDAKAIEDVVINLVDNAVKYKREDVPQVITLLLRSSEEGVLFSVSDRGKGISEEQKNQLFERWYQENDMNKGSGLGLAIVKRIVDAHYATISIESHGTEGTTFSILFPHNKNM